LSIGELEETEEAEKREAEDQASEKEAKGQGISGIYNREQGKFTSVYSKKQRKPKVWQTWKKQEDKSKS